MKSFNSNIQNLDAFASFKSTLEDAGAVVDGSVIRLESDNSNARMLVESLAEFGIVSPLMEAAVAISPEDAANTLLDHVGEVIQKLYGRSSGELKQRIYEMTEGQIQDGIKVAPKLLVKAATELSKGQNNTLTAIVKHVAASDPNLGKQIEAGGHADRPEIEEGVKTTLKGLGLDEETFNVVYGQVCQFLLKKAEGNSKYYDALKVDSPTLPKLVFTAIQTVNPDLYKKLKVDGKLNARTAGTASMAHEDDIKAALAKILNQVEVPDAFDVEVDDTEWDNAVITAFGFPMINLTSTLVRDMLRAPDPTAQKRSYKEFKKQLKADPSVATALGVGVLGKFGMRATGQSAGTDKKVGIDASVPKEESVGQDGNPIMEGVLTDIKNTFKSPVEILKAIAQNKGTPCRRNNLVVMYDDIAGKSGDSNESVKATPLGVSGGVFVDLNKSVQVPVSQLAAFYSVVDPKASFGSYAKAMAEVNTKRDNAEKGLVSSIASGIKDKFTGKKTKEANAADAAKNAAKDLAEYFIENGHPPFYLLKPKSEPKEIDRWCDGEMNNGFQMVIVNVDGHKAGMILKGDVAETLFKVG